MGVRSYHIERPEDIESEWLESASIVGVTAGASTPDDVIQAVVDSLTAGASRRPRAASARSIRITCRRTRRTDLTPYPLSTAVERGFSLWFSESERAP